MYLVCGMAFNGKWAHFTTAPPSDFSRIRYRYSTYPVCGNFVFWRNDNEYDDNHVTSSGKPLYRRSCLEEKRSSRRLWEDLKPLPFSPNIFSMRLPIKSISELKPPSLLLPGNMKCYLTLFTFAPSHAFVFFFVSREIIIRSILVSVVTFNLIGTFKCK